FIKEQGDAMDYRVAMDTSSGLMAERWMQAAGERGIPCAFVVDQAGVIALIGHPLELEGVLDDLLAGPFDRDAFAQQRRQILDEEIQVEKLFARFEKLCQKGKPRPALAELDRILAEHPEYEVELGVQRFELLLQVDEAKAYEYARTLSSGIFAEQPFN